MRTRFFLLAALLLGSALLALAAATPSTPGPFNASGGGAILLTTDKGLFTLRDGVLGKFELPTLKQVQTLEMFGKMPDAPAAQADQATRMAYYTARSRRTAPAIMIAQGDSLIVVIGDGFARLSQDTLAVEAHADLTPPAVAGADATQQRGFQMDPMPGYLLTDTTLYLMRPQELFAITTADGKLTRTALAKELAPLPNLFGGGGGRLGGGGGRPGAGAGAAGAGAGGGAGAANATGAGGATHHHHTNGGATTDGGAAATTAPATTTTVVEK